MTEPRFESVTLDPRALGFLQFKAASLLWRPNFRSQVNTPSIFPLSVVYGKVAVENVFKVCTSGIFCGVNNEIKEDLLSGSSSRGSTLVHLRAGALPGGSRGVRAVPVPLPCPLRLQNQEGFPVSSYILWFFCYCAYLILPNITDCFFHPLPQAPWRLALLYLILYEH